MHPWLLHSPTITAYGALLVSGLVLAWLLTRHLARRSSLDPAKIDLLVPFIAATGLLGAYAVGHLVDHLLLTPAPHPWAFPPSGTVLLGSMLLATLAGIAYALFHKIPLGLLGDITAPAIALGITFGRLGCFCAGCCYGVVSHHDNPLTAVAFPRGSFPWIDHLSHHLINSEAALSLPVYPVQLYESAFGLLLALALAWRFSRRKISGERFLLLGLAYSAARFLLEFIRADNPPLALNLTFSQLICILVFLSALLTLLLRLHWADTLHLQLPLQTKNHQTSPRAPASACGVADPSPPTKSFSP